MANLRSSHDVTTGVAGVHWLIYLVSVSVVMTSLPRADSQTTSNEVQMTMMSQYPNKQYDDQLNDKESTAYSLFNNTACSDIVNAVTKQSAGTISACSVFIVEKTDPGLLATINVTALLDGKTSDERFTLIKTAVVQVAAGLETWIISEDGITNDKPTATDNTQKIQVTMRLISTKTDQSYADDYKDPLSYTYSLGSNTMCDEMRNALVNTATVDSCEVEHYEEGNPGLKAYMKMKVTASGTDENTVFLSVGETIVSKANENEKWVVILKDITLIPAKKPAIDTKSKFRMKVSSKRVDLNATNVPSDPNDSAFKEIKDAMCEDFMDALYMTAVIETCEASDLKSADPGVTATITLLVDSTAGTATDGFISTSAEIINMSAKRDIWTVNPGDIVFIEEIATQPPPRSGSWFVVQIPAMFLLTFVLPLIM